MATTTKLNTAALLRLRIANQLLATGTEKSIVETVAHMGAIQAQDAAMSKWAIGKRAKATEPAVSAELDRGTLIRTHVMRPTWHIVAAGDVRWLLELTSAQVARQCMAMCNRQGLDTKTVNGMMDLIAKNIQGKALTREEVVGPLNLPDRGKNDIRPALLLMQAEQIGIVCSGPTRDKELTYASLDDRVPEVRKLSREEALRQLALRYYVSHGPATIADFVWWSGLTITDARTGTRLAADRLASFEMGDTAYYAGKNEHINATVPDVLLLPAFDEYLISYKDRSDAIASHHQPRAFTSNGIFRPIIVVKGKVAGIWKRVVKRGEMQIETTYFETVTTAPTKKKVNEAIEQFRQFAG